MSGETSVIVPLSLIGQAGSTIYTYEDLQVSAGQIIRPGGSDPTWRTYNLGIGAGVVYSLLGFATGNHVDYWVQTSHSMALSTVLEIHVHWMTPTSDVGKKIKFQLDVVSASLGGTYAVVAGSPFVKEIDLLGSENTNHMISTLADIPAVNTTVSTLYAVKFTRIVSAATAYASEVYVKYIDCHIKLNTLGSLQENSKV